MEEGQAYLVTPLNPCSSNQAPRGLAGSSTLLEKARSSHDLDKEENNEVE